MTDNSFAAIDAAMQSLRSYRRDKVADRKRQTRAAIAQSIDAWAAKADDEGYNCFIQEIAAAASEKNRKLILAEYPLRKVQDQMTNKSRDASAAERGQAEDASDASGDNGTTA